MKRTLFDLVETATVVGISIVAAGYAGRGTRWVFEHARTRFGI